MDEKILELLIDSGVSAISAANYAIKNLDFGILNDFYATALEIKKAVREHIKNFPALNKKFSIFCEMLSILEKGVK